MKTTSLGRTVCSFLLLFLFLPVQSFAQEGYVALSGGYGLSAGSQQLESKSSGTNREGVYGSFGKGIKFGITGGYMFSQHVGGEIAFSYIIGSSFEGGSTNTAGTSSSTVKRSGSGFMIVPGIVVSGAGGSASPYAKAGVIIGILKVKNEMSSTSTQGQTRSQSEGTLEETGGVALGFAGGVGIVFNPASPLSFFAEVALVSVAYSPSQIELTKATQDGRDILSQVTEIKADFKESYSTTERNVQLAVREPFGSVGINVGVRLNL